MSEIGLGLAALGRPAYINLGHASDFGADRSPDALRAQTHAVLDHAYARGVRYLDAARSYGLAEDFLGSWLRERVFISGHVHLPASGGGTLVVSEHGAARPCIVPAGPAKPQLVCARSGLSGCAVSHP